MAKSTMKYLGGDMFFKKWSMPLIPWSQLPVMKYDDYLKLFAVDQTLDISSRRFGLGGAWKFPHHGEGAKKLPPRFRSAHPSGVHILCDYFKTYVGEMLHVLRNISYTQIARSCLTTLIAGSFQTCNKPCFRLTIQAVHGVCLKNPRKNELVSIQEIADFHHIFLMTTAYTCLETTGQCVDLFFGDRNFHHCMVFFHTYC